MADRSVAAKGEGGEEGEMLLKRERRRRRRRKEGKEGAERKRGRGEEKGKDIEKFFH